MQPTRTKRTPGNHDSKNRDEELGIHDLTSMQVGDESLRWHIVALGVIEAAPA
jgi:hypothetical protein